MAARPSTARSEISSILSDDVHQNTALPNLNPSLPNPPAAQHGYNHLRGVVQPTNRSLRSTPAAPSSASGSSRPQSPVSQTSKTHVPSLTAQGFYKPMSSQRLQAQRMRGGRLLQTPAPIPDSEYDGDETRSQVSSRQGPYHSMPRGHRPVASIATDWTQSEVPENSSMILPGLTSNRDRQQATQDVEIRPQVPQTNRPPHLNLVPTRPSDEHHVRSPRSVPSALSHGSRHPLESGHEHLSSNATSPKVAPPATPIAKESALGKNYEYFEGNTVFWMGGRFQNARDQPINIATGIILVLPAVLFFIFSAPWLWHHVSPAIPIVFAYLFFICLSSFIHASLVDPGIIPRNVHPFPPTENDDPLAIGPPTNDWVMVRLATSETAAMDVPVKYCKTCNIWRPPRCYHCRVCDNCVETLDHHCVWLNNCVGRRNYRYFFTFVSSGTLVGLMLAFASLGHILAYGSQNNISISHSIDRLRVPLAMFIYGILAFPYPGALWVYHLMLMGKGETTREYLASRRFPKSERHRPFTQGNFLKNWISVLCRPKPPTYLHFKKEYEDGDQRFGSRKGHRQAPLVPEAQNGGMEMKPVTGTQKPSEGSSGKPNKTLETR